MQTLKGRFNNTADSLTVFNNVFFFIRKRRCNNKVVARRSRSRIGPGSTIQQEQHQEYNITEILLDINLPKNNEFSDFVKCCILNDIVNLKM